MRLGLDTKHEQHDLLLSSLLEAMRIQTEIEAWDRSLPEFWKPREIADMNGRLIITYPHRWMGIIWMMYQAVRIIFYHGIIQCCQSLITFQSHGNAISSELVRSSMTKAEENLIRLTRLVCHSIPYALGEIDVDTHKLAIPEYNGGSSYNSIWPLALVSQSIHSNNKQKQLCKDTLARIRSMYGIRLAESAQDVVSHFFVDQQLPSC